MGRRPPKGPAARRPLSGRIILVVLAISLALSLMRSHLVSKSYRESERELAVVSEALARRHEDAARLHTELDAYFADIIVNLDQHFIPLDRSARMSLRGGQRILERIVAETNSPLRRAWSYCTLGHINSYRHNLKAAIDAYRRAMESAPGESVQPLTRVRAYSANHLVGALAQLGHEAEALSICGQIVQSLEQQIQASSTAPFDLVDELAFATRNRAVLLASQGDLTLATEIARTHVQLLIDLLIAVPTELTLAERLIDAKYLLAGLLWRHPNASGRAESIQLLQQVSEAASALQTDAERRLREGGEFDYGKYKSASRRASQELAIARTQTGGTNSDSRRPSFWTRKNLYRGRRSIGTELLLDAVRMPAEFESQEAMILKWSGREWYDVANVTLVRELASKLTVLLLVDDYEAEEEAREQLTRAGVDLAQIRLFQVPSNTVWVRDFGPISVLGSEGYPIWIDYHHVSPETRSNNDQVVERLGRLTGHRVIRGPLLLEGGNLLSNGEGLLVCTQQLERDNVKLGFTAEQFRARLKAIVGGRELLVLENLKRERTGHVDWFLTFVTHDTVVVGEYDPAIDAENAAILNENAEALRQVRVGLNGARLKVVRLPMPPHPSNAEWFGGSYTNVVFANGKLLVPQWPNAGATMNAKAVRIYQELLPDWQIVPVDCSKMLSSNGAIHCATCNVARMPVKIGVESLTATHSNVSAPDAINSE